MTLFDHSRREHLRATAPLAERVRPRSLGEFVGQEHIVGSESVLARAIAAGHVPSMVLWGPPGSGKTTLAHLIAAQIDAHFDRVSAVTSGVADLRRIVSESRDRLGMTGTRSILFIDEIHRFSKSQQDVILPHVEDGSVILIGATTENPSFEVISPLLSRARVYVLKQLTADQVSGILDNAMADTENGLGHLRPDLEKDARSALISLSNGDARAALNTLELAVHATAPNASGERIVTLQTVEDAIQRRASLYDRSGDQHYDTISAFIKSVRSSRPGRGDLLAGTHDSVGRGPRVHRPEARRAGCRRHRHGRSQCTSGRSLGPAGGKPDRNAGGKDSPRGGDGLSGDRSEEQPCLRSHRRSYPRRGAHNQRAGPVTSAQRGYRPDARLRLRAWLRVRARTTRAASRTRGTCLTT